MFVYLITNKISGKRYVGQTVDAVPIRFQGHCHKGTVLHTAIKKYGRDQFVVETLGSYSSRQEMNEAEAYFISFYDCMVPKGYNLTSGGENNYFRSDETKLKISRAKRGVPNPKLSEVLRGRHCNPATEFKKGFVKDQRGSKNVSFGKPAHNRGRPGYMKGKRHSLSTIGKQSEARKKYWDQKRLEGVLSHPSLRRPVICLNNGMTYPSQTIAALGLNISPRHISSVVKGKRNHTYGYRFKEAA
jgi:group I intron endonuclease